VSAHVPRDQEEVRGFRRKCPEVHGKVVDFMTHSIEDGPLYFSVGFPRAIPVIQEPIQ
jgi:hypothetical protein